VRFDADSSVVAAPTLSSGVVFVLLGIAVVVRRHSGRWLCGAAQKAIMRSARCVMQMGKRYASCIKISMPSFSLHFSSACCAVDLVDQRRRLRACRPSCDRNRPRMRCWEQAPRKSRSNLLSPSNRVCPRSRCCTLTVRSPTITTRGATPLIQGAACFLEESREGTYIVSWRALSEVDGHVTSGIVCVFGRQPIDPAKLSARVQARVTSTLDMIARALTFIGQGRDCRGGGHGSLAGCGARVESGAVDR